MAKKRKDASQEDVNQVLAQVSSSVQKLPKLSLKSVTKSNEEIKSHPKFDKFKRGVN